jgi:plastocyanin
MKRLMISKSIDLKWGVLALVAIVWVTTSRGASASPASDPQSHSSTTEPVSAGAPTDSVSEVKVDNFAFTPGAVTVKVGTQVTWVNRDDIPHTVDSTDGKFKSAALDTDDKFQFRFTEPGEYPYYCRMHPKMTGKIIVQP